MARGETCENWDEMAGLHGGHVANITDAGGVGSNMFVCGVRN